MIDYLFVLLLDSRWKKKRRAARICCAVGGGAANVNGATIQLQAVYLHRLIIPIPFIRQMFNSPSNDVLPIIVTTVIKNES